ncbi:MAG TPA: DHA2 family efflux MFS transporter permease subunit [Cellvibrio sp.]|nr:DHA2 family efflux MFS transporter permease subunit [Cellvibrio sp.]
MDTTQRKWLIALSVSMGGVMSSLDTFILYVATPNLRGIFSATIAEISWISTSYAIASMICMFLSAWSVERFGSKNVYQTGLGLFVVGSACCALSHSLEQLIMARIIQGLGAGLLLPVEGMILRRTFPPAQHGLIMGLYGTSIMLGPALGPMLGGIMIDQFSWQFVFIINIPIGIISFIMVQEFMSNKEAESTQRNLTLDVTGLLLLAASVISLVWLLERGDRTLWLEDDFNLLLMVVAAASWAMLFAHSLAAKKPLLDFSIFSHRTFAAANMLNFFAAFMITGTLFVLPIYMQELLRFSPTQAGTTMAPRALVMMLAFPLVGWLFNRVPTKMLISFGLAMGILSGIMMADFTFESGWHDMILPQIVQGIGAAFILGPVTTAALISIPKDRVPAAAALESTTRLLGSTIGIAVFASLITQFEMHNWENLRHHVTWFNTVLYKRFSDVMEFYLAHTASVAHAREMGYHALRGRVNEQVLSLTYMQVFQLVVAGFVVMAIISLFISSKKLNHHVK